MKKLFAILLSLVMLLSLAACGEPAGEEAKDERDELKEETVTLYVVTGYKNYYQGQIDFEASFSYDKKGRPVKIVMEGVSNQNITSEITYDEHGNRIQETVTSEITGYDNTNIVQYLYKPSYSGDQMTSCDLSFGEAWFEGFDLEYDDQGNLVLIDYSDEYEFQCMRSWHSFEYDEKNRLTGEIQHMCYPVSAIEDAREHRYERYGYRYDKKGRLAAVDYYTCAYREDATPEEAAALEFTLMYSYTCHYDSGGRFLGISNEEEVASIYEMDSCEFDRYGNLIRFGDDQNWSEYTYEAIELTEEEAQMAKRLIHGVNEGTRAYAPLAPMDPLFLNTSLAMLYYPPLYTPVCYLVPYPMWDN